MEAGGFQVQPLPNAPAALPPALAARRPGKRRPFPEAAEVESEAATLSCVLSTTTLAIPRLTFHALCKLLRFDALAVLALEPLEISPPEPGNNPGNKQAHWEGRGSRMLRGRQGSGEVSGSSARLLSLARRCFPQILVLFILKLRSSLREEESLFASYGELRVAPQMPVQPPPLL